MKRTNLFFYSVIALCLVYGGIMTFRNWQKDIIIKKQNAELAKWSQDVKVYSDQFGLQHSQAQQYAMPLRFAIEAMKGKVDTIKRGLHIKNRQLQEVTEVNSKITGQLQARAEVLQFVRAENKALKDSLYRIKYNDRFLEFKGELNTTTNDFNGSYVYSDSLSIIKFKKSSFWKEETFVDVVSNNPNRSVEGLKSIKIGTDKIRRFSLGPQLGYYYDPAAGKWVPAIGIGLAFNVIRF